MRLSETQSAIVWSAVLLCVLLPKAIVASTQSDAWLAAGTTPVPISNPRRTQSPLPPDIAAPLTTSATPGPANNEQRRGR
jgi:hypothetical protein